MASKENQTLQIFIISLVILVILLAAGLIWVNSNRKAAVARADSAKENARNAQTAERQIQAEAFQYKVWMGFAEADASSTIEKTFHEDMERYGSTFEESSRRYRIILENIYEENRKLSQSEVSAKQQVKDLKRRLGATEKEKNAQIDIYVKDLQKVEVDAASERNKFEAQYRRINEEKKGIASQLAEQRNRYDDLVAKHASTLKERNDRMAKLERFNKVLKSDRKEVDPFAQPEDGLIRWVNQRNKTVWINLGEADHLRPQVTFRIYSGDEADALGAVRKASIEVTRILSAKMAEARITDDVATNPVMEGDKIYSQVWSPGRQVGFAITGIIDMDGDGRSDLDRLKSVIALNNGKVDAVPGPNGTIDGQMSVDTRYLILGDHPDKPRQEHERRTWERMSEEADTLGIEPITLTDFLQLMGWQSERRTVKLGIGAQSKDFTATKEDVTTLKRGRGTDSFRPRKPQPTY
ncbi:MAG: hypothetical protein IH831_02040 [Planctomycetes bacterium]|nr:hypothetical protein [Planctomycetota bacterium]